MTERATGPGDFRGAWTAADLLVGVRRPGHGKKRGGARKMGTWDTSSRLQFWIALLLFCSVTMLVAAGIESAWTWLERTNGAGAEFALQPILPSTPSTDTEPTFSNLGFIAAVFGVVSFMSLLASILYAARHVGRADQVESRLAGAPVLALATVDYEGQCRLLCRQAETLWRSAEAAVFALDEGVPLRTLLFDELKAIAKRLAANPTVQSAGQGSLTVGHHGNYWRTLCRDIERTVRDLERVMSVAEAGRASFGDRNNEPRIPRTREEAYFAIGANPGVDQETLQRLVRALRQCWHPDLAQNDLDRRYREARIRQINVANDIIRADQSAA